MKIPKPATRKARIEIIPMIDAIFFLLVFFMFSSLSMIRMRGSNVALPARGSGTGGGGAAPPKLIVSVTSSGGYFLNKTPVARQNLQSALQDQVKAHAGSVIVVNMAKTQTTQTLVDVLDSLTKVTTASGAPAPVLIATEPVDSQGNALSTR